MNLMSTKKITMACLTLLILQIGAMAQNSEFNLGMVSARSGDFQTALSHFQKSLDTTRSDGQKAQGHYNIGVCLYRLGKFDRAVTELERAVSLKKDYEKAFYALGMAYTDLQNWTLAEMAFQKAVKLADEKNGEAWFDLAFVQVNQKKYDEAFKSFQKAIKYGTTADAASHNNIGVIYALNGNLEKAVGELETAKKLGFQEASANLEYLNSYTKSGENSALSKLLIHRLP